VAGSFIEDLVTEAVLWRIEHREKPSTMAALPADAPERLALAYERYAKALRELVSDYYVERKLTRDEWYVARDGLEHQLNIARRFFDPSLRPYPTSNRMAAARLRREWVSLDVSYRRDVIASELEYATVHPVGRGGKVHPSRIVPTWWDRADVPSADPWPHRPMARSHAWVSHEWMRTREVATLFGVSEGVVWRRAKNGELPLLRVGNDYRFVRKDVTAVAEHVVGALTVDDVALRLCVGRGVVTSWIRRRRLVAFRYGNRYYVKADNFEVWAGELRRLIHVREAARLLHVTPNTVYSLVATKKLHTVSAGRSSTFLDLDEVNHLAESREEIRSRSLELARTGEKGAPARLEAS
jgi:excisionase family DNA binding protein